MTNDNIKFRLEVALKAPEKGSDNPKNQYIFWYNTAQTELEPESFGDVDNNECLAFRTIASWIADEYLLCKLSTLDDFVFGNYGYELGDTNTDRHDKMFYNLKKMILGCLVKTFNRDFFEHNKDKLQPWTFYEYSFDVSFDVEENDVKRTSLKVKKSEMKSHEQ